MDRGLPLLFDDLEKEEVNVPIIISMGMCV